MSKIASFLTIRQVKITQYSGAKYVNITDF